MFGRYVDFPRNHFGGQFKTTCSCRLSPNFNDLTEGEVIEIEGGAKVSTTAGHHPGGVLAYRVDYQGKALVYATDTEHRAGGLDQNIVNLAKNADVFIYDSQYTPE